MTRDSPASDEIIRIVLRNDSIDDAAHLEPAEPDIPQLKKRAIHSSRVYSCTLCLALGD
jgi:hypothetical protein